MWLVRLSLLRKILRIFCLTLVYEEQDGEAASCLQSLSKQLKEWKHCTEMFVYQSQYAGRGVEGYMRKL